MGVSQDDAEPARQFAARFGVSFPILLDSAGAGYLASNAYPLGDETAAVWCPGP